MGGLLVINTGGTIGMVPGPDGLQPGVGVVEAALARILPMGGVKVVAFDPLRDSADMGPEDWNRIADLAETADFAGVLVIHGTDTMAMTGAALAAVGVKVPLVLCGSMVPLGMGGDAEGNLALAVQAVQTQPVGVWLAFGGQILPAGALVKTDSHKADSFRAADIAVRAPSGARFDPARKVGVISITAGMSPKVLAAMLDAVDAAVLRVFGAGTFPGNQALVQVLANAVAAGKRLRAVSQCPHGGLTPGAYAAGAGLWAAGVENGGAETPEAALALLWLNL